jgi:glycosyltransferase involved in cell wall biosynthesis
MAEDAVHQSAGTSVAYVLKGFPRISETFIASEIHRLERLGVRLRLFVLKPSDEPEHHAVVERIRAVPLYLPATSSISSRRVLPWLAENAGPFLPALGRVARRRPRGLLRAWVDALAQAVRARRRLLAAPRKIYLKEMLYAVALADRLLADPQVRHLHAHFAHGSTTVAWLASTITGLPFSFTGHAKDIYTESLNPAGLLARKMAAAQFVVTCTQANRAHLRAVNPSTPVHVVYHGLSSDFTDLTADAPARPSPPPVLRVLGVGRLVPKKGFDTFVEACAALHRDGYGFEAVIAGEAGSHSGVVRRLIADNGLGGCVSLLGPQSPAGLYAEYRRASVVSLACRVCDDGDRDGMPNVLLEAMACGTPVVSTSVSGIPELIEDGANGLLVPPGDAVLLAQAWRRIGTDSRLAARLGAAGRATVERFDGDRSAAVLAGLFAGSTAPVLEELHR